MYKNTAQIEKMAAIESVADPKIISDGKIMADVKKTVADPRILVNEGTPVAREKQAVGKILAGIEISVPGEIPAAIEKPAEPEKHLACLLFRLGGISSC
jgi:hypothetical protein